MQLQCCLNDRITHVPHRSMRVSTHPVVRLQLLAARRLPLLPAPLHAVPPPVRRRPLPDRRCGSRWPIVMREITAEQIPGDSIRRIEVARCEDKFQHAGSSGPDNVQSGPAACQDARALRWDQGDGNRHCLTFHASFGILVYGASRCRRHSCDVRLDDGGRGRGQGCELSGSSLRQNCITQQVTAGKGGGGSAEHDATCCRGYTEAYAST